MTPDRKRTTGIAALRRPRLSSPVQRLSGVGPRLKECLNRIRITRISDLLFHLPYRYIDRTHISPLGALVPGQEALIQGEIELTQIRYGRRRSLLCRVSDGTGALLLRFFHFSKSQQDALQRGCLVRCWGQVRRGPQQLEMVHPEYEIIGSDRKDEVEQTLTPVYPSTEGLAQGRLRRLTDQALAMLVAEPGALRELVPPELMRGLDLPPLAEALQYVHRPPQAADTALLLAGKHPSQRRLVMEELLAHQLGLRMLRREVRSLHAPSLDTDDRHLLDSFMRALPFRLTGAQTRVLAEVQADLREQTPMLRLLQGDVGSGKTVIAAFAAVQSVAAGFQAAIMAPTELLAEQHLSNLRGWMATIGVAMVSVTGRQARASRDEALARLVSDEPLVAVGTHALFQEKVRFGRLGLVVIDEQHRFGVHQRLALLEKGIAGERYPHQLIMTATPIPRTLAMTVFADLDVSSIDELPPGRSPVRTVAVSSERRAEVIERIAEACLAGRQVYWVCPLIEESEAMQCQAAVETHAALSEAIANASVGLVHGRLKPRAKDQAMADFRDGKTDILVATTVIEVGVDVPNASLMVIENAERLGLSQLHQLRGRVGRGSRESDCVLLYQGPIGTTARARLDTMRSTSDGFSIAQKDLELRGPGELLGERQTGLPDLRVADLVRDAALIPRIQKIADQLLQNHADRVPALIERWIPAGGDYGGV